MKVRVGQVRGTIRSAPCEQAVAYGPGAPGEAGEDKGGDGEAVDHVQTQRRAGRGLENNTHARRAQGVR